ncbi:MAG: hypothetical protein WEC59_11540 [Salibacteraceae bacterium]
MADSFKYGVPAGLFAFAIFLLQFLFLPNLDVLWRWFGVSIIVLAFILFNTKMRNKAFFPFRFAFLSGFNSIFVMVVVQALLILLFSAQVLPSAPDPKLELKWKFYQVFTESLGFMFAALIVNTVLAFTFKKKS